MSVSQAEFVANFVGNLGRRVLSWQLPLQFLYGADIIFLGLVRSSAYTSNMDRQDSVWVVNQSHLDVVAAHYLLGGEACSIPEVKHI